MEEGKKETVSDEKSPVQAWARSYKEERSAWIVAGAVLLGSIVIAASMFAAMKPNTPGAAGTGNTAPTAGAPAPGPAQVTAGTASLDNDPVLGDRKKAKVAIIEFSDYECPFCQRFHKESFDQIVKDYVTTGKAVFAYRDYPLPFHEPNASKAANLAHCVKEAKGDQAYFDFSKLYYASTQSNGKGLAEGKQNEILTQVGVNAATITACATAEKFKDEIAKDMSDAQAAGVSGTPSFIVGKLGADGTVTGEVLVGALPYAQFKTVLDKYAQ